jgi:subtilisin family serine protease
VGASLVWQRIKDSYGNNVTGRNVIVGFVDTGIDTTHQDFRFPNGTTKILSVWDQTVPGRSPSGFNYGFECSSIDIESETCPEQDTFGHGTHIAGIATSSGQAPGHYTGVAPDANIIFVKSGNQVCNGSSWTFDDANVLDGINYIVNRSRQLGRKAVINLSLGGNIGGHDGTDPLEVALDAFVRGGTSIVVAAGNEAKTSTHVHGQLNRSNHVTVNVELRPNTTDLQIDIWYSMQDRINTTLISPDGLTYPSTEGAGIRPAKVENITSLGFSTLFGQEVYFEVKSPHSLPQSGWKIKLTQHGQEKGAWDAWVDANSCSSPPALFLPGEGYWIDPNDTISIPGNAHNVVTVGAYVTKPTWFGSNGESYGSTASIPGAIAPFSSLGPTRDGRIKPDIVAPGMFITSSRSHLVSSSNTDPDPFHRVLAGTSMAAPHVAGIIALMLQYAPSLSATQIANSLRNTARYDSDAELLTAQGLETLGFGKADARTATGFYRFSILTSEVPRSVSFRVNVDGNETSLMGGSSFVEYFIKGSTHHIDISKKTYVVPSTRYLVKNHHFVVSNSSIEVLKYKKQYLVSFISSLGTAEGSGWYDANATIRIDAPKLSVNGYVALLGAQLNQIGWLTTDGEILASSTYVRIDHPTTFTALYMVAYPPMDIVIVLAIGLTVLVTLRLHRYPVEERQNELADTKRNAAVPK